ncbi:MAG: metal-dependent transcriptional regulator [Actinomycetaceae bacterium]|nr:metal-dependent transcriptional regulator [Actinomycetaceae bacterium]
MVRGVGAHGGASAVAQDYLKILWAANEEGLEGLSVNELAQRSGVVASTASENVRRLVSQGLVTHAPYRKVHLTQAGWQAALGTVRRHRLLETYLHDMLGFDWDEVHEEAEILEHAVSDRLLSRIDAALGHPRRDPHGDPIPSPDGQVDAPETVSLGEVPPKTWVKVARVSDRDPQLMRNLEDLGVGLDVEVLVEDSAEAGEGLRIHIRGDQRCDAAEEGSTCTESTSINEATAEAIQVLAKG